MHYQSKDVLNHILCLLLDLLVGVAESSDEFDNHELQEFSDLRQVAGLILEPVQLLDVRLDQLQSLLRRLASEQGIQLLLDLEQFS